MPKTKGPRKPFNVVLSSEEYDAMQDLARVTGLSAATVLRTALMQYHMMKIKCIPICANGQTCFVPHMHSATHLYQAAAANQN